MSSTRKQNFGKHLRELRSGARTNDGKKLSLRKLAELSGVDFSLISAVERGQRNAGEKSLRKLAKALSLAEEETEVFVEEGLSAAGSNQVLDDFRDFPTVFLHILPREILTAFPDMDSSQIEDIQWCRSGLTTSEADLVWRVGDKWFAAEISASSGSSPSHALRKLREKLSKKGSERP